MLGSAAMHFKEMRSKGSFGPNTDSAGPAAPRTSAARAGKGLLEAPIEGPQHEVRHLLLAESCKVLFELRTHPPLDPVGPVLEDGQ